MKQKRAILLLAGAALLIAAAFYWFRPGEPSYQGKSASAWFKQFAENPLPLQPSAIPANVTRIVTSDGQTRDLTNVIGFQYHYRGILGVTRYLTSDGRAWLFTNVIPTGFQGQGGVRSPTPCETSLAALKALGSNAVPCLLGHIEMPAWEPVYVRVFTNLPRLIQRPLPNPSGRWQNRFQALTILGLLGAEGRAATPVLVDMLAQHPSLKGPIMMALRTMHPDIPSCTQLLLQLGESGQYATVVQHASSERWDGKQLATLFGRILRSPDTALHRDAIKLLESAGPNGWLAKDAMIEALQSSDHEMRYLAARAVEHISAESPPEIQAEIADALQVTAKDQNDMVRNVSRRTLVKLGRAVSAE